MYLKVPPQEIRSAGAKLTNIADEMNQMLRNVILGGTGVNANISGELLYGKTGTGKTAASKFAREQLIEAASKENVFVKIEHIRCTDYTTEYQVIAELCNRLGRDVPNRGWTKAA